MTNFGFYFSLSTNALTGAVPTELGNLESLTSTFTMDTNELSSSLPTELGKQPITYANNFRYNKFCSDVPTEVQALSSRFTGNWRYVVMQQSTSELKQLITF